MTNSIKDKRDMMSKSLKGIVVPEITLLGFSGIFPHFRRIINNKYEFISFQFNLRGGSFIVETSFIDPSSLSSFWKVQPFEKLNYANAKSEDRLRLKPDDAAEDYWYNYESFNENEQFDNLSRHVKSLLYKVDTFLGH